MITGSNPPKGVSILILVDGKLGERLRLLASPRSVSSPQATTSTSEKRASHFQAGRVINTQEEIFEVQPGDFALVITHEKLKPPTNILGRSVLNGHRGEYVVIREGKPVFSGRNRAELARKAWEVWLRASLHRFGRRGA